MPETKPADVDGQLMRRAKKGDRGAFAQLVQRHQNMVYGYLRARVLQPNDAEDLTQEVFLRCYQGRRKFKPEGYVAPWLLGIARNLLREYIRKKKRRKEVAWTAMCLELDEQTPEESEDGAYDEALRRLPGCLDSLNESAREAIDLRYSCQMRLKQIGKKLRRSEGAIKLLMFRARQSLKSCLDGKLGGKGEG